MFSLSGQGKEALLYSIAALCVSCHKAISTDDSHTLNEVLRVVSSACTKKAKKYREAALSCLEQVIIHHESMVTSFPFLMHEKI